MDKKKIKDCTLWEYEKNQCKKNKCWDCPLNHFLIPCHTVLRLLARSEREIEVEERNIKV